MTSKSSILSGAKYGSLSQRLEFAEMLERAASQKREQDEDGFLAYFPDGKNADDFDREERVLITDDEVHQRRLEQLERETYQKVFEAAEKAGFEAGMQKMEERIKQVLPRVEAICQHLEELPALIFKNSEQLLVELSISLTRSLVKHELDIKPEGVIERVQEILTQMAEQENVTVFVPENVVEILRRTKAFQKIHFEADNQLDDGSLRVESAFGGVEYRLDEMLSDAEMALRSHLDERLALHKRHIEGTENGAEEASHGV
ncbi:FliH/SctL family protein [Magnetococcales bacterium HHB-1]